MIHLSCLTVLPLVNLQMRIPASESFLLYAQNIRFSSNISRVLENPTKGQTLLISYVILQSRLILLMRMLSIESFILYARNVWLSSSFSRVLENQLRCWQILFFLVYPLENAVIRMLGTEVFFCPRGKFGFVSSFSRILKKIKKDRRFLQSSHTACTPVVKSMTEFVYQGSPVGSDVRVTTAGCRAPCGQRHARPCDTTFTARYVSSG